MDMDRKFVSLAATHGAVYSRYADDLTFSGDDVPSENSVRAILNADGFSLREDKCRLQRRGRSQYVTGLSVSDSAMPRLPKRLKSRLRLVFHYIAIHGLSGHWEKTGRRNQSSGEAWLEGMLRYAASIEPVLANQWQATLLEAQVKRRQNILEELEDDI
jgi:RNA-directed DNA polymerase